MVKRRLPNPRKVTVVESGKLNREVTLSNNAYNLLKAIGKKAANNEKINRSTLAKEAGINSLDSAFLYTKELKTKIGSELDFQRGPDVGKKPIVSLLPIEGKPVAQNILIKSANSSQRNPVRSVKITDISKGKKNLKSMKVPDIGYVSEELLETKHGHRTEDLLGIAREGEYGVKRKFGLPSFKNISNVGWKVPEEKRRIDRLVKKKEMEAANAYIELGQDNRRTSVSQLDNLPAVYGGLKALANEVKSNYVIMNDTLYRKEQIDREKVLVKVVPLDVGKNIASRHEAGDVFEMESTLQNKETKRTKLKVIIVNGNKIAVPLTIAERMAENLGSSNKTKKTSKWQKNIPAKEKIALADGKTVEERVYNAFKELEKEGNLTSEKIAEKAGTTKNTVGFYLNRLRKKKKEKLLMR